MIPLEDLAVHENPLPVPPHFDSKRVGEIWKVFYQERAEEAKQWSRDYHLQPAYQDELKIALILVDMQNTFCIPGFELFVGGRSGMGAVEDVERISRFIYRNLNHITHITLTLDTHRTMQIFHRVFLVNEDGEHPAPYTLISYEDIKTGHWMFNRDIASTLGINAEAGQRYLLHYTKHLDQARRFDLTVWPYHAMLGGIGHALVPAIEEAVFFYTISRASQPEFIIKGDITASESYSAIGPEILTDPDGEQISQKSDVLLRKVLEYDAVVIAGEAKSHCLTWTIDDLLNQILAHDSSLTNKIYLMEDCTSSVVIPDVIDYTDIANEAYKNFAESGMHIVQSTDPITNWSGIQSDIFRA